MPCVAPEESSDQGSGQFATLGLQSLQEVLQGGSIKSPIERTRLSIAQLFVQPKSLLHLFQAGEVVWSQNLPLDDREVDLHLIQPTGMHRRVDQDRLAMGLSQSPDGRLPAVRRAVVHDPEDPTGRPVGLTPHDLLDQSAERVDASLLLTPAQDSAAANIPSSQVLQGSAPLVLMLDAHRPLGARRQSRVASNPGLDARLLIRADDIVPAAQPAALPGAGVQIQDATRLLGELRVAREDPVLIPPWLDCVGIQDAPDGAGADGPTQGCSSPLGQVRGRQATQRQLGLADGFTGDRLDDRAVTRGKKRACDPGPLGRPRRSPRWPSGVARGGRSWGGVPPRPRPRRATTREIRGARGPAEPSGAGRAAPPGDGPRLGIDQGTPTGTWGGPRASGQAWCDSIRGDQSVLQPNARRIGRTARHHNPTVNCE